MRAHEFLREDIENFPIANVRRANGAIGNQGVNIEQAADVLTHAAGMQVSSDMTMRQLVDALRADPAAQQRLRQFVQKNPITVSALPDGSYHLLDGHHRTFLLNLLGDETVPAVVKEGVAEGKQPGQPVVDAILKVMPIAQEIWFHGSRATGKHRKNSDTDILVVVPDDLVGDQYLGVVRILQKLSSHFDNYDIQPTHPGYNIHLIAQEEGRLLWSNKQGVAEAGKDNNSDLDTIIQKFVDSPSGQKYKAHDCKTVTRTFVAWAEQNNIPTEVITFAPPSAEFVQKNPQLKGKSGQGDGHIMPIVNGNAIDFTIRQFGVNRPFDNPLVTPVSNIKSVYSKFGYFTDTPDWFLNGKTHWRGPLKSIPSTIFNQDFGDELLENFADGKKPGRKGLAKRSGVDTKASVSSLRKTAKNSSGEKQRMAHWLANMKAGRAKAKRK